MWHCFKGDNPLSSLGQRIVRAGLVVAIAHVVFKFSGLIQVMVMGRVLPARDYDMSYVLAFEGCVFALFMVGEQIIGPSFLPVFMKARTDDDVAAWRFADALLTLQTVIILAAVAVLMLFPENVVRFVMFLRAEHDPEQIQLAADSLRLLAPMLIGLSLGSTTYMLLNAQKRFFLAAFGDAVWKLVVAGMLLVAWSLNTAPWSWLVVSMLAGSILKLITHLVGLRDTLNRLRPVWAPALPAMRRMFWLALPLLGGILFALLRDVFNNITVPSALNIDGVMQANSMGRKLHGAIHHMVPYALSIAVFPFFCELTARNERERLGELMTRSGRLLLTGLIPFALLMAALAEPLTALVFRGGEFDALAVRRTSVSLMFYTLVIPAAAMEAMLMQAFFADRRTLSATVFGLLFSSLSMLLSWLGLRYSNGNELILLAAIAGGFALSRTLKTLALMFWLRRHLVMFPARSTSVFLLRIGLVALAGAATARVAAWRLAEQWGGWLDLGVAQAGFVFLCAGALGGLSVLFALWLLRVDEWLLIRSWIVDRLKTLAERR